MKFTTMATFVILVLMLVVPLWFIDNDFVKQLNKQNAGAGSENIETLREKTPKDIKPVVTDEKVVMYRWYDDYGRPQFSSKLPEEDGVDFEEIVLEPTDNVIEAFRKPEAGPEAETAEPAKAVSLESPYSPGEIKRMMDEASDLQSKLNEQQAGQQKAIEELVKGN